MQGTMWITSRFSCYNLSMAKIAIIYNENSGHGSHEIAFNRAVESSNADIKVYKILKGKRHRVVSVSSLVKSAWNDGRNIIVAAGGDGTVSAVAGAILEFQLDAKLGVLPLGTLNHFARDLGIPKTLHDAMKIVLGHHATYIDTVKMNSRYFINNSSLGLYPFMVRERDVVKRKGIRKFFRMLAASLTTLKRYPFITIEFETENKKFERKTPFVFIGNNSYTMEPGKLGMRSSLSDGILSVYIAHTVGRLRLIRLAWHAFRGRLIQQHDFDTIGLKKLTIHSKHKKLHVAHDGEISKIRTPIHYEIVPRALHVIIP